jgi:hypothetical protein
MDTTLAAKWDLDVPSHGFPASSSLSLSNRVDGRPLRLAPLSVRGEKLVIQDILSNDMSYSASFIVEGKDLSYPGLRG